jgi:hypothetical protein
MVAVPISSYCLLLCSSVCCMCWQCAELGWLISSEMVDWRGGGAGGLARWQGAGGALCVGDAVFGILVEWAVIVVLGCGSSSVTNDPEP